MCWRLCRAPGGAVDGCCRARPSNRYRLLETLRDYGLQRLAEHGQLESVQRRHAAHFRRFAEGVEVALRGRLQRETMARLREKQPNIRAAISWFTGPGEDRDAALLMAGSLGLFWHLGRHLEGRELLDRAC